MAGGQLRDVKHFVDILDTLDAIVWEAEASTFEFTYVSEGAERILGYPIDQWIGNPGFWESLIHPDDRERTVAFCKSAAEDCRDHKFDYRAVAADGRALWLQDVVRVVRDDDGTACLLRGVMTDITERVEAKALLAQSEERYRLLSELTSDYAWSVIADADGEFVFEWVTDAIESVYGRRPDDVVGSRWLDVVHPDDRASSEETQRQLLAGHHIERELRIVRSDRDVRWVHAVARRADSQDGKVRIVGSSRDITDRKEAEREREHLQQQLLQSQKMDAIGRLAGGVAHDFNNILAAILNYAVFIRDEPHDATAIAADAGQIVAAAERAAALTRQLLVFSRRETPQPEVLDLRHVVTEHSKMLVRMLGERVELGLELSPVPAVMADRTQIEQVLLNLAVNARDAMPDGGPLTITLDTQDGHVRLRVADPGVGMSEAVRERVFEPFFTTKPRGEGTGLGLSSAYGIVEALGGHIRLHSVEGEGTTVEVLLPPCHAEARQRPEAGASSESSLGTISFLVVEDEEQIRKIVQRMLTKDGHKVSVAADARQALLIAEERDEPPNVVITDVVMPGMSGTELAREVRQRWPGTAIVFMSGYPRDVVDQEGELEGPLVEKPFNMDALRSAIAEALLSARS